MGKKPKNDAAKRVDQRIGENLRRLREARGWSAREVADAMATSTDSVCKHERGIRGVDVYKLLKYQKLYGVSLDWIIFGEDRHTQKSDRPQKVKLEFDD